LWNDVNEWGAVVYAKAEVLVGKGLVTGWTTFHQSTDTPLLELISQYGRDKNEEKEHSIKQDTQTTQDDADYRERSAPDLVWILLDLVQGD
jgi:hypothetical protein